MGFFARPKTSNWLVRLIGPKISITVTREWFEFRCGDRVVTVRPLLFVRDGILVGVGYAPAEAAQELPVFVPDQEDRAQRLGRLVKFGIQTVLGATLSVRPVVSVSLQAVEVSFQEIETALTAAGAGIVTAA